MSNNSDDPLSSEDLIHKAKERLKRSDEEARQEGVEDEAEPPVSELAHYSKAEATWRGYASDYRSLRRWASEMHDYLLPDLGDDGVAMLTESIRPEIVAAYIISNQDRLRSATIGRHLSAIKHHHSERGLPDPTAVKQVRKALDAIVRRHQYDPKQAGPIRLPEMQKALAEYDLATNKGWRDMSMLLFGWWSARRRSELVGMDIEHLEYRPGGVVLTVPFSKTDQTGEGRKVPINHQHDVDCPDGVRGCEGHNPCPVCSLQEWIEVAGIKSGPVWRYVDRWGNVGTDRLSGQTVSLVLKDALVVAGMNPAGYNSHSLRSGYVSTMDDHGVPRAAIRAVSLHQSEASMDGYARPDQLLRDGAGAYLSSDETV